MGEIADSIINGDFDYITGEYIGEGDGYPRTMQKEINRNEFNHRASIGIRLYLKKNNIPPDKYTEVVRKYFVSVLFKSKNKKLNEMCAVIQQNFQAFDAWFKNKYLKP